MKLTIYLLLLGLFFTSCTDEVMDVVNVDSDAFKLREVSVVDSQLLIKVSYSGGCAEHDFEIIWPDAISKIYPPDFSITLTHDANGDMCDAYPTEVLVFDLSNNPLGLSEEAIASMRITVINGSDPAEMVSNR